MSDPAPPTGDRQALPALSTLPDRAHFDTEQITARQARLEAQYAELGALLEARRQRLAQSGQLFSRVCHQTIFSKFKLPH